MTNSHLSSIDTSTFHQQLSFIDQLCQKELEGMQAGVWLDPLVSEITKTQIAACLSKNEIELSPYDPIRYDPLMLAFNPLIHAEKPTQWLSRLLNQCSILILIESFPSDSDVPIFGLGHEMFSSLLSHRLGTHTLPNNSSDPNSPVTMISVIKGRFSCPHLHLDGYPTTFHPLPTDLTSLHLMINPLEEASLPYFLGIVPAHLTRKTNAFLTKCKHMIPVMHGVEHGYQKLAPKIQKGKTIVSGYHEFKWKTRNRTFKSLSQAKTQLEDALGRPVFGYQHSYKAMNKKTIQCLNELNFHYLITPSPQSKSSMPAPIPHLNLVQLPMSSLISYHLNEELQHVEQSNPSRIDESLTVAKQNAKIHQNRLDALADCFSDTKRSG